MKGNRTFTMIKPDGVKKGHIGSILKIICDNGFKIISMKMIRLSIFEAKLFYKIHEKREFYKELINYITSGPVVVISLEKENAVEDFRSLIGSTDPKLARPGSIRNLFAESISENVIHGSDSDKNAINEINFHFSNKELF